MSGPNLSAEVVLPFGDGKHLFKLGFKQLEQLEKVCGSGIAEIANRVMALQPKLADLYNVILLGLEGGGMPAVQAQGMMERYFDGKPLAAPNDPASPLATAAKVMQAAWFGMEDIKPGEAPAGESPAKSSTSDGTEPSS